MDGTGSRAVAGTALIVGASRGLGLAIVQELADRGWRVIGTVREGRSSELDALAARTPDRVVVETLDIVQWDQLPALAERLAGVRLDLLFVNAGTTYGEQLPIGAVPRSAFTDVMVTNALAPMHVIEGLMELVAPDGLVGAMSSGQGSIGNNTSGLREVYRGSKAALNMLMKSLAVRHREGARSFLLLAPGWIRTDLGGADAPSSVEEAVPGIVDVMLAQWRRTGIAYLDRSGQEVPW